MSLLTFQEVLGYYKETCRGDHINVTLLASYPIQLMFTSLGSLPSLQNNNDAGTEAFEARLVLIHIRKPS